MVLEGAEVYSLNGKKIGSVLSEEHGFIVVRNKGILTDEEFRIPVNSILSFEIGKDPKNILVKINLDDDQLKHGMEFLRGKPNSDFVSGRSESEPKVPMGKQVIRYETRFQNSDDKETSNSIYSDTSQHDSPDRIVNMPSEYACDMCSEKFQSAESLQNHRSEFHKSATGI